MHKYVTGYNCFPETVYSRGDQIVGEDLLCYCFSVAGRGLWPIYLMT
ncbi:hypothetical protein J2X05_004159 [Cellvibrio fibrivorans]|uniref:Uncharacterized protein n=1 Tax=Cellvibrio fibrivorans TaxID=126350 RepID=A0ABU1V3S0_9GAMM|nr:hypothetical protein [Cellvibrio fibrivorans]